MTLDELLAKIEKLSSTPRDTVVLGAPELFVTWPLFPVPVVDASGKVRGELQVAADVFSVGTPEAPLRVPLSGPGAQALADGLGMMLPTPRMASLIYDAGTVVLHPEPMGPPRFQYDGTMVITDRFKLHNEWVEKQREGRAGLVVGHKKDVVTTKRLAAHPEKVAIYGWFQKKNSPLQPFQQPHEAEYADYSHGIRLVAAQMTLDGETRNVADVLRDPATASLLSDEGALDLGECHYKALSIGGLPRVDAPAAPAPAPAPAPTAPVQTTSTEAEPAPAAAPERVLRIGTHGEDVRAWQQRLVQLGYHPGTPDGLFGGQTESATKSFQSARGLTPDGVVGPGTRKAADEAAAQVS